MQPFKALCINSDWRYKTRWNRFKAWLSGYTCIDPVFGQTYTVVAEEEEAGIVYYVLAECNPEDGYNSAYFIPISDKDETELKRELLRKQLHPTK